jgi:hypothetical protein
MKKPKPVPNAAVESFVAGMQEIRKSTPKTATSVLIGTINRGVEQGGTAATFARALMPVLAKWETEDLEREPAQLSMPGMCQCPCHDDATFAHTEPCCAGGAP